MAGVSYDIEFRLGEAEYRISSETGHFCRAMAGEQLYGQLSSDSGPVSGGLSPLMQVLGRLGVAKLLGK